MMQRVSRDAYPWWVKLGLIGSSSRRTMWAWLGLSLLAGVALLPLGLWADRPYYAVVGVMGGGFAALMYWLTIHWIDRHGSWEA